MKRFLLILLIFPSFASDSLAYRLSVTDNPNDDGARLLIRWEELPPPELEAFNPEEYKLERASSPDSEFMTIAEISRHDTTYRHVDAGLVDGLLYYYRLNYSDSLTSWQSEIAGPGIPEENWFNTARTNVLIGIVITGLLVALFIFRGRRGESPRKVT